MGRPPAPGGGKTTLHQRAEAAATATPHGAGRAGARHGSGGRGWLGGWAFLEAVSVGGVLGAHALGERVQFGELRRGEPVPAGVPAAPAALLAAAMTAIALGLAALALAVLTVILRRLWRDSTRR